MEDGRITMFSVVMFFAACVTVYLIIKQIRYNLRRKALMQKYNDETLVERLMKRTFWQGMSTDLLIDSLGKPVDIDQKVLKTKIKEIWKYGQTGVNRFRLRITLENGVVVGWDQK